ncbi:hypothetical protein BT69DRAFT_386724 [Atractiella rhizophila]|nr:hypothetical protein BT69DRAFT_386724 [Atractiella rhizophila]
MPQPLRLQMCQKTLRRMIPSVSAARLPSLYHTYPSLPLALDALLSSFKPPASLEFERSLKIFAEMFPSEERQQLRVFLGATEGDVDRAMDLMQLVKMVGDVGEGIKAQKVVGNKFNLAPPKSSSSTSTSTSRTTYTPTRPRTTVTVVRSSDYSSTYCFKRVQELEEQRNGFYRSAANFFRTAPATSKPGVAVYTDRGKEADKEMRVWQMRGSKALVRERMRDRGTGDVDLHGLTAVNAVAVVKEFTDDWWTNKADLRPPPLRIITGVGRGSPNQVSVLVPAVGQFLDRGGWKWAYEGGDRGSGVILVKGRAR